MDPKESTYSKKEEENPKEYIFIINLWVKHIIYTWAHIRGFVDLSNQQTS